uniref:Uncharacterized protein n=1 Tax=Anopheles maculatus TaxID=74869 RepID=A0A182S6U3_9DIPT
MRQHQALETQRRMMSVVNGNEQLGPLPHATTSRPRGLFDSVYPYMVGAAGGTTARAGSGNASTAATNGSSASSSSSSTSSGSNVPRMSAAAALSSTMYPRPDVHYHPHLPHHHGGADPSGSGSVSSGTNASSSRGQAPLSPSSSSLLSSAAAATSSGVDNEDYVRLQTSVRSNIILPYHRYNSPLQPTNPRTNASSSADQGLNLRVHRPVRRVTNDPNYMYR